VSLLFIIGIKLEKVLFNQPSSQNLVKKSALKKETITYWLFWISCGIF